jgi:hypothetical protein
MAIKAIGFIRLGNPSGRLEIYTDPTSANVDTQATALANLQKFSAGTFSGVAVEYAVLYPDCDVSNFKNDRSTHIVSGKPDDPPIVGSAVPSPGGILTLKPAGMAITAGNNDNLPLPDGSYVRIFGAGSAAAIRGIVAGKPGRVLVMLNVTGQAVTFKYEDSGSVAANRIHTSDGADKATTAEGNITMVYDGVMERWLVTGFNA